MTEVNEKHKLRDYKGYTFMDAGVRVAGDNGVNLSALEILDSNGAILYTMLFSEQDPNITLNKTIEKAKVWVNENGIPKAEQKPAIIGYSSDDLVEFNAILLEQVAKANKEQNARSIESDEYKKVARFIQVLKAALERIDAGTYGICKVTGKMIPKDRLLQVPYATMSEEGKAIASGQVVETPLPKKEKKPRNKKSLVQNPKSEIVQEVVNQAHIVSGEESLVGNPKSEAAEVTEMLERKCRVCGCTQNNCQQCVEKTGSPCHWVEDDLCSACVVEQSSEIKVIDTRASSIDEITPDNAEPVTPGLPTNFFRQLREQIKGTIDVTIRIMEKDNILTVGLFPAMKSKTKPVNMKGTPEDLDEGFFVSVIPQSKGIPGLVTNIEEVKGEAKKKQDNKKSPPKTHVKRTKPTPKKKASPKKNDSKLVKKGNGPGPVKKKVTPKKPGPQPGTKYKSKPGPAAKEPSQIAMPIPDAEPIPVAVTEQETITETTES